MSGQQITIYFDRERDTLRTVRFQERVMPEGYIRVGVLYVSKQAVAELGTPETLRITVEDGDNT